MLCSEWKTMRAVAVTAPAIIIDRVSISFAVRCLLLWLIATGTAFAADSPEKAFDLVISRGTLPAQQRVLRVEKDAVVRLRVTADVAGEIHVHAYRLAAKVTPAIPAELNFTARATGRFRIEWHGAGDSETGGHGHAPPLAILEVRPK
jgi:hypothetical protein